MLSIHVLMWIDPVFESFGVYRNPPPPPSNLRIRFSAPTTPQVGNLKMSAGCWGGGSCKMRRKVIVEQYFLSYIFFILSKILIFRGFLFWPHPDVSRKQTKYPKKSPQTLRWHKSLPKIFLWLFHQKWVRKSKKIESLPPYRPSRGEVYSKIRLFGHMSENIFILHPIIMPQAVWQVKNLKISM